MMMQRLMALAMVGTIAGSTVASTGCGALFNDKVVTVMPPPGGMVDGVPGPMRVTQNSSHIVTYPNGGQCMITSSIGAVYLVLDLVLVWSLIPLIVDAATGDWAVLDPNCPGVMISG